MIDKELNDYETRSVINDFMNATNSSELLGGCFKIFYNTNELSAIISLEDYFRDINPYEINKALDKYNNYLVSYFETSKLYFVSKEILGKMFLGESVDVQVDFSIMFDSNIASYIYKLVNNIPLKNISNDFYQIIDEIIRKKWNFDYLFYIIENYKNIRHLKNVEHSEAYINIIDNLAALELFKSIDCDEYIKTGKIEYLITSETAKENAIAVVENYYFNEHGKKYLDNLYHIKQMILIALIGMVRIKFESKRSADNKIKQYFEFVSENIGINLERETLVAYEYFKNSKEVQMFDKFNGDKSQKKLLFKLDNIAWDFLIPRVMESSMITMGEGEFFLPYFLTFDSRLSKLLRLFKMKGVILDKSKQNCIPFRHETYSEVFVNKKVKSQMETQFHEENTKSRVDAYFFTKENYFKTLLKEYRKLRNVLKK